MVDLALDADIVAELRGLTADLAWPDAYEVLRRMEVEDGGGGRTTTEQAVEAGMGALNTTGLQPSESELAGRLGWTVAYVWEIPHDTVATPSDRLRSGNRYFQIGGVARGGAWGISCRLMCREVG